ncbi:MAG: homocysteine S-methyltransferase family protein [Micrococcales bacterium]|nr:homocysteine S-methyltransferase family protein [Micrococcales bacterium]
MSSGLREVLGREVIIADGAMGTQIQAARLRPEDFAPTEGCPEILNVTKPQVIEEIHAEYLAAGVDAVTTNTFGANLTALADHKIADRLHELAFAGARLARHSADQAGPGHWVFGSMGPGTKLPSLGTVPFSAIRDAYQTQATAMLDGGADLLLIETCQDLLQAKAAAIGAQRAVTATGVAAPVIVQVTVEPTGTLLLGTETRAAVTALAALGIDGMGLNCATGPDAMGEHLRQVAAALPLVSVMPNAGLPDMTDDGAIYRLAAEELAQALAQFVEEVGVAIVGGCCGTTPEHLAAVVRRLAHRPLPARSPADSTAGCVSSLYHAVSLRQDATILSIGERTNAQGSKAFREAIAADDLDTCVAMAREQARNGAHVIDLSVDAVGRDGPADMARIAARFNTEQTLPVMVDSTDPATVEAALECLGGRAIVNSVNLEDGGVGLRALAPVIREHGAAVVALTIDEEGQARTAAQKVRVADRLIETLVELGFDERDIIIDPLTFPIATGAEETRRDGAETLRALQAIHAAHPAVGLMLGVSNVSFGLAPPVRVVLNSVFLFEAMACGLSAAIIHPGRITPLDRLDPALRDAARALVWEQGPSDALAVLLGAGGASVAASAQSTLPVAERLRRRIIEGNKAGLADDLEEALRTLTAAVIVDDLLLPAMAEVGEQFGAGQTQLPFVLQSAEAMKAAVTHLEPHLAAAGSADRRGQPGVVLATVRGDVHDIGKDLVDIVLSNNGFTVHNLGIKQPLTSMLAAAQEHDALAIGMSGLLVKSVEVMRENLAEMNARGLRIPVILGGAALTRRHVEESLAPLYAGEVRYAKDAFEGLTILRELSSAPGNAAHDGGP